MLNFTEGKSALKVLLPVGNVSAKVNDVIPTESYLFIVANFCFIS